VEEDMAKLAKLIEYFQSQMYQDALTRYQEVAEKRKWSIRDKFRMYNWAKLAFESQAQPGDQIWAFGEIYDQLRSYWQVFRNARYGYWSDQEIFAALTQHCRVCARQGRHSLLTVRPNPGENREILNALKSLEDLKPSSEYPFMPVAKFTHFFNPKLFPIWDNAVMWNSVMNGVFKVDYRNWCLSNSLNPNGPGAKFNLNYVLWAGHYMRDADPGLMRYFAGWFATQVKGAADEQYVLNDVHEYYATAFEYITIGAAELQQDSRH
jgi:hypothetical protein